jgi:hypothetical protein
MKKIILPVLIICLFVACKSKSKPPVGDSVASSTSAKNQSEELMKKFKPMIQGEWLKKDYIDEITKTKSPQQAYKKVGNITEMAIDTSKIKADSILVNYNSGHHEVGDLIIKFHAGNSPNSITAYDPVNSIERNYYELKISEANKSLLTLYTFDKNKKIVDSARYFKLSEDADKKGLGDGTTYIINKILVIGDYTIRDSSNNVSKVSFKDDGKITGMTEFKDYSVMVDFMTPPNNLDEIVFDPTSEHSKSFAFKVNADTLNLYETKAAADSVNLDLGKLKYKLVRQK